MAALRGRWDSEKVPLERGEHLRPFLVGDCFSGPELQLDEEDDREGVQLIELARYRGPARKALREGIIIGATPEGDLIVGIPDYSGKNGSPILAVRAPAKVIELARSIPQFVEQGVDAILA